MPRWRANLNRVRLKAFDRLAHHLVRIELASAEAVLNIGRRHRVPRTENLLNHLAFKSEELPPIGGEPQPDFGAGLVGRPGFDGDRELPPRGHPKQD
jgi:hypothetical protein